MNGYTPPTLVSAPQTPIDFTFPRHTSWRVSAHSPTASYSEIDYDDAASVLSHIRPTGWRGVLKEGGLGIYLLSTNKGWRVYIGILCLCSIASGCGLLTMNWLTLKATSFKFPYPITTTLLQLLISHLLLMSLSSFTRLASPLIIDAGLGVLIAPAHAANEPPPTSSKYRRPKYIPRFLHRYTRLSTGIAGGGILEFERGIVKALYPLAAVYSLMLLLGNIAYADTEMRIWTMIRIGIVPLTAIFTTLINRTWPSWSIILIALSGALGLLVTCIRPDMRASPLVVVTGILSSIAAGAWPEGLVNAFAIILSSQSRVVASMRPSTDLYHTSAATPPDTRATYQLFHHLSVLSIMMLLPVTILSGELQAIVRDYEHFSEWWPWFLLACGAACTAGSLVTTVLLAKATSPLTVNYLGVPMYCLMVIILAGGKLEIYAWGGVVTVAICSGLFWRERVKESGRREKD